MDTMRLRRGVGRRHAIGLSLMALVALACMLAACGAQTVGAGMQQDQSTPTSQRGTTTPQSQATTPPGDGTLTGDVVAGPTCPVERAEDPCPPKPVPNREVRVETTDGALVATTTTDGMGHFRVALAPGSYAVRVKIGPGMIGMRQMQIPQVRIGAGQTVNVLIELDTGIR